MNTLVFLLLLVDVSKEIKVGEQSEENGGVGHDDLENKGMLNNRSPVLVNLL